MLPLLTAGLRLATSCDHPAPGSADREEIIVWIRHLSGTCMHDSATQFGEQVGTLLPRLRRFARALTRHPQDADDLVQLAVERALTRRQQWRPDSSLTNWMLTIVRNAWIDEIRARRRRSEFLAPPEDAAELAGPGLESEVEMWAIQSALERLPHEQRLAVALVLIEGLSYQEAAQVLEVPIGTLTSRLARGRMALQSMLADPPPTQVHGEG